MSEKKKIMVVIGTRPEAIKMAPIVKALARQESIKLVVCLTSQHKEMLQQVLDIFEIKFDIDLEIMTSNQTLSGLTAAIINEMDKVIRSERPDWVLVQGDTTTVMAVALVAFYNQVRIGHVEAGLRSFNKMAPFPEEINRKIAGAVADLHFAPTELAKSNLVREGIPSAICHVTGNTVIDALLQALEIPFDLNSSSLSRIPFFTKRVITITAHRRENHGQPLQEICDSVLQLCEEYKDLVHFVYPVHLNPNVQAIVKSKLADQPNISLLDPLDYLSMAQLVKRSYMLLTDSGGLQEEAPGLGVPVLVLRDVTERPEGVKAGCVKLVGTRKDRIVENVKSLLDDRMEWERMATSNNPYGDGKAADRIVRLIMEHGS